MKNRLVGGVIALLCSTWGWLNCQWCSTEWKALQYVCAKLDDWNKDHQLRNDANSLLVTLTISMLKTDIWAESQVTLYPSYTVNQIRIGASRIKAHQIVWNVCTVLGGIWKYMSRHTFIYSKVCAFIMLTRCYFMTQMSQYRCIDLLACIPI